MSYNLTSFKVKKLENFILPIKALYASSNKNSLPKPPQVSDIEKNEVIITGGCGQTIKGILKDGLLYVTELKLGGECSGTYMNEIIEPAFKESKGILEAVCIWEGGDSVNSLSVINGEWVENDIDL